MQMNAKRNQRDQREIKIGFPADAADERAIRNVKVKQKTLIKNNLHPISYSQINTLYL